MTRFALIVLACLALVGAGVFFAVRPDISPVSGHRLERPGEVHAALSERGPWVAYVPGDPNQQLVAFDGSRVSVFSTAVRVDNLREMSDFEGPIYLDPDLFPICFTTDGKQAKALRCQDGRLVWQGKVTGKRMKLP